MNFDSPNPTLLYGYGGFEVPVRPYYAATIGCSWLENGGIYVVANIRGGGEFGPKWHKAALKENRQRAYDDFIAVSEDLIKRNITSTERLGILGGSNGGLLVGVAMLDLTASSFIAQTIKSLTIFDVFWGLFKSAIFALLIAWIGCLRGFQVRGGAASVGQGTTSAVVSSIFLIILADAVFAVILRYWG